MPQGTGAPFIYLVQMDIPAEHEADFNPSTTPSMSRKPEVPGVRGCARYVLERTNKAGLARYLALYEVDFGGGDRRPGLDEGS